MLVSKEEQFKIIEESAANLAIKILETSEGYKEPEAVIALALTMSAAILTREGGHVSLDNFKEMAEHYWKEIK